MSHMNYSVTSTASTTQQVHSTQRRRGINQSIFAAERQHAAFSRKVQRSTFGLVKPGLKTYGVTAVLFCAWLMYQSGVNHPERYNQSVEAGVNMPWSSILGGSSEVKAQKPEKEQTGNAYAPVSSGQLTEEEARAFVEKFSKIAVEEQDKYGIPASISLAQGLVESRAGTSRLARNNNNFFGIKCFSKSCVKGHCTNHFDDHHKDFFRKFKTAWESWRAHSKMLAGPHYAGLKKHGKNYKAWASGLQKLGYATDSNYASKIIGMIEKYQLYQFDDL